MTSAAAMAESRNHSSGERDGIARGWCRSEGSMGSASGKDRPPLSIPAVEGEGRCPDAARGPESSVHGKAPAAADVPPAVAEAHAAAAEGDDAVCGGAGPAVGKDSPPDSIAFGTETVPGSADRLTELRQRGEEAEPQFANPPEAGSAEAGSTRAAAETAPGASVPDGQEVAESGYGVLRGSTRGAVDLRQAPPGTVRDMAAEKHSFTESAPVAGAAADSAQATAITGQREATEAGASAALAGPATGHDIQSGNAEPRQPFPAMSGVSAEEPKDAHAIELTLRVSSGPDEDRCAVPEPIEQTAMTAAGVRALHGESEARSDEKAAAIGIPAVPRSEGQQEFQSDKRDFASRARAADATVEDGVVPSVGHDAGMETLPSGRTDDWQAADATPVAPIGRERAAAITSSDPQEGYARIAAQRNPAAGDAAIAPGEGVSIAARAGVRTETSGGADLPRGERPAAAPAGLADESPAAPVARSFVLRVPGSLRGEPIWVRLLQRGERVDLRLSASAQNAAGELQQRVPELLSRLEAAGFDAERMVESGPGRSQTTDFGRMASNEDPYREGNQGQRGSGHRGDGHGRQDQHDKELRRSAPRAGPGEGLGRGFVATLQELRSDALAATMKGESR